MSEVGKGERSEVGLKIEDERVRKSKQEDKTVRG